MLYSLDGVFENWMRLLRYRCPSTNREYFKFVPSDELEPGDALEIRGHDYEELLAEYGTDPSMNVVEGNVKLTFVVIDGLPNDSIDYVEEQWGENVVVESHSYYYPEESM